MKKILVTGSAGFIFSNFMRQAIHDKWNYEFISIDQVLASYNRSNAILNKDHKFYMGDIADQIFMENIFAIEKPDYIIHGAAQSFVGDSITGAGEFIHSNVVGTQVIVDMAVKYKIKKFIYISTDEVYGHLINKEEEAWTEESITKPRNPYSASKLCGELIVYAANQTHGLEFNITRCSNNFGKNQPPRNLVPRIIMSLIYNQAIPIHGSGKQIREWLYVDAHCEAIMKVLNHGVSGEIYNIGSGYELTNLEMIDKISSIVGVNAQIKFIKDRPGHDFRYSINCDKIKQIGWANNYNFDDVIENIIYWYIENKNRYTL